MSKRKLEEGGLLGQEDVSSSAINTVPGELNYLKSEDFDININPQQQRYELDTRTSILGEMYSDDYGVDLISPQQDPSMYKSVYKSDFQNSLNMLGKTIREFKMTSKMDQVAKLQVNIAKIENARFEVDALLNAGKISNNEHAVLTSRINNGEFVEEEDYKQLYDIFGNMGVNEEDVSRANQLAEEYGLTNKVMDTIYDESDSDYEAMLKRREKLLEDIDEREEKIESYNISEDWILRGEISENRNDRTGKNTGDYLSYQAAKDFAGTLSTAEGWLYSVGLPIITNTVAKAAPAFGRHPLGKGAAILANIASTAYGIGLSRYLETSMESGEVYFQTVEEMTAAKQKEKADNGLDPTLTTKEKNDIAIEAYKGIETLKNKNYKLGVGDALQFGLTFMKIPGLGKGLSGTSLQGTREAFKNVNRAIQSKTLGKVGSNLAKFSARVGLSREIEGSEEGLQFRWTNEYLAGDASKSNSFISDYAEYAAVRTGMIEGDPKLYNNLGFKHAVQSGKDMASMMTGAGRTLAGTADLIKYRQAMRSLAGGEKLDDSNASGIENKTILDAYLKGNLKNLKLALYRLGDNPNVEGLTLDQAKENIKKIEKAEQLLDKIYGKGSALSLNIGGFGVDLDPNTDPLAPAVGTRFGKIGRDELGVQAYNNNKQVAFLNAMEIVSLEENLEELQEKKSEYASGQMEGMQDLFGMEGLTQEEQQSIQQKLKERGIDISPYDLQIEETKAKVQSLRSDNKAIATGDSVVSSYGGLMSMSEFRSYGELRKRRAELQKKGKDITEVERAELQDIQTEINKIEYVTQVEYLKLKDNYNSSNVRRAVMHNFIANSIAMLEKDPKAALPKILNAMAEKGMRLDKETLETVMSAADNAIQSVQGLEQLKEDNKKLLEGILNGSKGLNGESKEYDPLTGFKPFTPLSKSESDLLKLYTQREGRGNLSELEQKELADLRDRALTEDRIKQIQEEIEASDKEIAELDEIANLGNKLLSRDINNYLIDDSEFVMPTDNEVITDTALNDVIQLFNYINNQLTLNPDYADINTIADLIAEIDRRQRIFVRRAAETGNELFVEIADQLDTLYDQATALQETIAANHASRTASQVEFENQMSENILNSLGMNSNFEFIEGSVIGALVKEGVSSKELKKIQDAVTQEGEVQLGDKVMAAMLLANLVKTRMKEDQVFNDKMSEALDNRKKDVINSIKEKSKDSSISYSDEYLQNPSSSFDTRQLAFIDDAYDIVDQNSPTFKYQDHKNLSKYLEDVLATERPESTDLPPGEDIPMLSMEKASGVNVIQKQDLVDLLQDQLELNRIKGLELILESDLNPVDIVYSEKFILDNPATAPFKPTKQQLNAVREILFYLDLPEASSIPTDANMGDFSAMLQGAAGTGKTKVVLQMAMLLSGLGSGSVFTMGHNASSSKTLSDSLNTDNNTVESFLELARSQDGFPTAPNVLIIDEAFGFTDSQITEVNEAIVNINRERKERELPLLKVILLGDPGQLTEGSTNALTFNNIDSRVRTNITPVSTVYRSDIPALVDFQNIFRRRLTDVTNTPIVAKISDINISIFDETTRPIKGVYGVSGDFKQGIKDRLLKTARYQDNKTRVIITDPTRVEEYQAFLQGNNITHVQAMSYIDAQGMTIDEVYMDIKGLDSSGNPLSSAEKNDALYTASSRASQLIVAGGLNIENTVDANLDRVSSGLSAEIAERSNEYLTEIKQNYDFISGIESLNVSDDVKTQREDLEDESSEQEDTQDPSEDVVEDEINENMDPQENPDITDETVAPNEEDFEITEFYDNEIVEVSDPEAVSVDYPEYAATSATEGVEANGQTYVVEPAQENKPAFAVVSKVGKETGVVIYQPGYTLSGQVIPGVFRRLAVLSESDIDKANWISPKEKQAIKDRIKSGRAPQLTSAGIPGDKSIFINDINLEANNILPGLIVPEGGVRRLQYKYKSREEVNAEDVKTDYSSVRKVVDSILEKFVTRFYNDSKERPSVKKLKGKSSLKIFKTSKDIREYQARIGDAFEIKKGVPYIILEGIDNTQGNKKRIQMIPLVPRKLRRSNQDDLRNYYAPIDRFIESVEKVEEILGLQYGTTQFRDALYGMNDESLQAALNRSGGVVSLESAKTAIDDLLAGVYAEIEREQDGSLARDENGKLLMTSSGPGPVQSALNKLARANNKREGFDGFRVPNKIKNASGNIIKAGYKSRGLLAAPDSQGRDLGKEYKFFNLDKLRALVTDNAQGVNEVLYLPIVLDRTGLKKFLSSTKVQQQIDAMFQDPTQEIYGTQISLSRTAAIEEAAPIEATEQEQQDVKVEGSDIDKIIGDFKLFDENDSYTTDKGELVTKPNALKELKRILPDAFRKDGTLKTDYVAFINGADMLRLTEKPGALGVFMDNMILVREDKGGIYKNVLRHEVFHKIFSYFLTDAQRKALLATARKEYSETKGMNDLQVEEYLADKFMSYEQNPLSFVDRIRNFFKKVLRFFGIVAVNENNIKEFFDNIEAGYFKGFKGQPLDAGPKYYGSILKEYGDTGTYRAAKHLLVRGLNYFKDQTKLASENTEAGVTNAYFNRDERFAYVKQILLPKILESLEAKQNAGVNTEEQVAQLKAARILSNEASINKLYKELYKQDAAQYDLENKEAESMQDQIIDASEVNHKNNLTAEVKDFLNNITFKRADGKDQIVSFGYAYVTALELFSGLDSSLSSEQIITELAKRQKALGNKTGSPAHAVIEALKDLVKSSTTLEINITEENGVQSSVPFTANNKFDTDKNGREVFIYHPTKDVSRVDVDIDNIDSYTVIRREEKETSARFLQRVIEASNLEVPVTKGMYKKYYDLNVFKNLFVNTASLRKEKFHMGDFSVEFVDELGIGTYEKKIKTRYYRHKEFGAIAAREATIKENIFDNYKGLIKSRNKINSLLAENKIEDAYFTLLDSVGIYVQKDKVGFNKSEQAQIKTAMTELIGRVYAASNKRKKQLDEFGNVVRYERNNKAKGQVKGEPVLVAATVEDALSDSSGYIKTISAALISTSQNKKAGSIRTAEGKTVFTFHNSSFGIDSLLGLSGQAPTKNIHIESNNPVWQTLYKFNIFTNNKSKVIDIADHDAYVDRKRNLSPTSMNLEKPVQWFERNFIYQFTTAMQEEAEGLSYLQQLHTVADTKNVRNARVPVLSKKDAKKYIGDIYDQSIARGKRPLIFTKQFLAKDKKTFVKAVLAELEARASRLEDFNKDNKMDSSYTSIAAANVKMDNSNLGYKSAEQAFIYNYAVNSFFLNQVVMGDTSSLGDSFKVIKRMKVAMAPGYKGYVNDQNGMPTKYKVAISEDPKANPFEYMSKEERKQFKDQLSIIGVQFDIADAQGYMLPSRRADIKKGFGTGLNIGNVLKPVYYGVHENGEAVAVKYSSIVLSDDLVNRFPALKKLRSRMEAAGVGEFIMDTAIKNGNPQVQSTTGYNFKTGKTNFKIKPESIIELDSNNFRIQLDPEANIDTLVSNPTQLGYFINSNGKNKAESVEYYDMFAKLIELGTEEVYRELGIKDNGNEYGTRERTILKDTIKRKLANVAGRRENSQREAAMLSESGIDINFPAIVNKSISLMSSTFESSVIKPKFPGQKLALMSDLGITVFEKDGAVGTRTELEAKGITVDESWTERPLRHMHGNNNYAEVLLPEALKGQFQIGDEFFNKYGMGFRIPSTELHSAIPLKVVGFTNEVDSSTLVAPKELSPLHGSDFDIDSLFVIRRATIFDKDKSGRKIYQAKDVNVRIDLEKAFADPTRESILAIEKAIEAALKNRKRLTNEVLTDETNKRVKALNKEISILNAALKATIKNRMLDIYLGVITDPKNRASMLTPINLKVLNGKDVNSVFDLYASSADIKTEEGSKNYKNSEFYQGRDLSDPFDEMYMHQSNQQGAKLTGIFANSMKAIAYLMGDDISDIGAREGASMIKRVGDGVDKPVEIVPASYTIDGIEYSEFTRLDQSGQAVFVALDALVNAAIDNANEQILNILNLNNKTAGYMALMLAQGVNLNTAAALLGQPALRVAFNMTGSFDGNLKTIRDGLFDTLDETSQVKYEETAADKLTFADLKKGLSQFRESDLNNLTDDNKILQVMVIDALSEMRNAQGKLVEISNALSIIQAMPNDLASIEAKKEQWGKLFSKNDDGSYVNEDTVFNSSILLQHPHIRAAFKAFNVLSDAVEAVFHVGSPRLKEYSDSFGTDLNRTQLESSQEVEIEFRKQILRYLTSSLENTTDEKPVTIKTDTGSFKLRGNRAFIHNTTLRVKELQNSVNSLGERLGDAHPFLSNITVERDRFNNSYIKASDTKTPTQEDLIDMHDSFNQLSSEDKALLVKYAIVNEGLEFSPGNITLMLPPNVLTDVSKSQESLLSRLFATGNPKQKVKSAEILDNVKDHFEIQYALNNPSRVQEYFKLGMDDNGDFVRAIERKVNTKSRAKSIFGTTIENGIVTDYMVPGGSHPKFLMNNDIGVLYIKVHEAKNPEGDIIKTMYQQVGKASSQVSAFSVPSDILDPKQTYKYNSSDFFSSQYVTRTVDKISQKELTLRESIKDQDGKPALKPGMKMIVKLAGDNLKTTAKLRTIDSISKDGLTITFKSSVSNIKTTPKLEQEAIKNNIENDSVEFSENCKKG